MPTFNIVREIDSSDSFRTQSVMGQFDLQSSHIKETFIGNIEIENKKWNIGVIFGNSGTGKSTIAKEIFGEDYFKNFEYIGKSIMDDMPKECSVKDISKIFNAVGFSSPPSWLKPYSVLSNGEKMRVDLARSILEQKDLIVFDEFTSVVDRNIAKIGSFAVQKTIRKLNKKFVAVSCHDDILEWLEPDWVFDTNSMSFFLAKNTQDLKSTCEFTNVHEANGKYLGNIII